MFLQNNHTCKSPNLTYTETYTEAYTETNSVFDWNSAHTLHLLSFASPSYPNLLRPPQWRGGRRHPPHRWARLPRWDLLQLGSMLENDLQLSPENIFQMNIVVSVLGSMFIVAFSTGIQSPSHILLEKQQPLGLCVLGRFSERLCPARHPTPRKSCFLYRPTQFFMYLKTCLKICYSQQHGVIVDAGKLRKNSK